MKLVALLLFLGLCAGTQAVPNCSSANDVVGGDGLTRRYCRRNNFDTCVCPGGQSCDGGKPVSTANNWCIPPGPTCLPTSWCRLAGVDQCTCSGFQICPAGANMKCQPGPPSSLPWCTTSTMPVTQYCGINCLCSPNSFKKYCNLATFKCQSTI